MKLLHVLRHVRLEDGGVVRAVLDLSGAMAERGHDVTLASGDLLDVPDAWRGGGANVPAVIELDLDHNTTPKGVSVRVLYDAIERAEVVHLHGVWLGITSTAARMCAKLKKPYVISTHGMLDDWSMRQRSFKKRLYYYLVLRGLIRRSAMVHHTAEAERAQAARWLVGSASVVLPNVMDLTPYNELPGPAMARDRFPMLREPGENLLFLSRLHVKKGPEHAIEMLASLRGEGRNARLLLAGTGEDAYVEALRALASRLGVADHAHFLGLVTGELKTSLYEACDLFVLPTSQENFGLVLPESLACGTPVITTRGTDIHPELSSCGGARIVEQSGEAFASAAGEMLDDREGLSEMGRRGRAWVLEALDGQRVAERYHELYEELSA